MSGAFSISSGHSLNHAHQGSKASSPTPASSSRTSSSTQAASASSHDEASHATTHDTQADASKHPSSTQASQDSKASHDASKADKSSDKSADKTKSDKAKEQAKQEKAFTAVFNSLLQDDKSAGPVLTASAKADPKAKKGDAKADASDGNQAGNANVALAGLPMFAADKGKGLPQLAWSGYVAVGDNKGAKAVAMQGDQKNLVTTQAVSAKDLPNAVLKAQEQLAHTQLQQGTSITPANNASHFTAALNKAHLPGLNMTHQFLADNANLSQTQAAVASSNAHNVLAHDLSGVAAATTPVRGDNATQQINVPVQQPQWGQQLGDRVQWLVGQNLHQAAIHLNPPDLGSLDVHIQMHGDQTNVNFSSPHAVVRHAVDAAIPRLREMLGETGLILGDVNVSGQALAQQHSHNPQNQRGQERQVAAIGAVEEPHATTTSAIRHLRANGMLDVYA